MTEQQLQDIRAGKLWVENDFGFEVDGRMHKLSKLIWPNDGATDGTFLYYRSKPDSKEIWTYEDKRKDIPTILASTLLPLPDESFNIQLYPLIT